MKKNNFATAVIIILIVVVLAILFALPRLTDPYREAKKKWKEAGIECLIGGHRNIIQHIHPQLTIRVDGEEETVQADIGNVQTCMAEIHTHDESGTIHVESFSREKTFTLGQFFAVWGKSLERGGYALQVTADGEKIENPENFILKDKQQIVLEYIKKE